MLIPNLRHWRERRALTQEELAEKAGIAVRSVAGYEAGLGARPGNVRKLANALDIEVSALMLEEEPAKAQALTSQVRDAGEEHRKSEVILFNSWAIALEDLGTDLEEPLKELTTLPDHKDDLEVSAARIRALIKRFDSLQHAVNTSGASLLMLPYVQAKQDEEELPNDLLEATTRYQKALATLTMKLMPEAEQWEARAEKTLEDQMNGA